MNGSELPIPGQLNAIGSTDIFWGEKKRREESVSCLIFWSLRSESRVFPVFPQIFGLLTIELDMGGEREREREED